MTDRADEVSIEPGTAAIDSVLNVSDYHQTDMFVRIKQIENLDTLLRVIASCMRGRRLPHSACMALITS